MALVVGGQNTFNQNFMLFPQIKEPNSNSFKATCLFCAYNCTMGAKDDSDISVVLPS